MISNFRREIDEKPRSSGVLRLSTFGDNLSVQSARVKNPKAFLSPEDRADSLFQNVGKKLSLFAA